MTSVAQYRDMQVKAMLEGELEALIAGACKQLGLLRWHTHNSKHSPKGWVDDVIAGPGGTLFRELKKHDGRVTPEQRKCIDALRASGLDVDVWRTQDWFSGRIMAELQAISTRR